jgi:hypothetical protein
VCVCINQFVCECLCINECVCVCVSLIYYYTACQYSYKRIEIGQAFLSTNSLLLNGEYMPVGKVIILRKIMARLSQWSE